MALAFLPAVCHGGWPPGQGSVKPSAVGSELMVGSASGTQLRPRQLSALSSGTRTATGSGVEKLGVENFGETWGQKRRRLRSRRPGLWGVGEAAVWGRTERKLPRNVVQVDGGYGEGARDVLVDEEGRGLRSKKRRKQRHKAKGYFDVCPGAKR